MRRAVSSCIAAMLSFGVAAFAQTTGQNPTGSSGQAGSQTMTQRQVGDRTQTQQQVTLVGCIQREAEFRQAAGSGRGGAMGTGIGVGNEFVLTNAKSSTEAGAQSASGTPTTTSGTPETSTATAGTSGTTSSTTTLSSGGIAYSLTGDRESELEKHVGQRLEIVGTLDDASDATATGPVSGSASQRVGDLKALTIVSFRAIGGTCTP
ncbi:MAG: hypothetical protein ACRD15_02490 [Vicinamibacterales bacterium]